MCESVPYLLAEFLLYAPLSVLRDILYDLFGKLFSQPAIVAALEVFGVIAKLSKLFGLSVAYKSAFTADKKLFVLWQVAFIKLFGRDVHCSVNVTILKRKLVPYIYYQRVAACIYHLSVDLRKINHYSL